VRAGIQATANERLEVELVVIDARCSVAMPTSPQRPPIDARAYGASVAMLAGRAAGEAVNGCWPTANRSDRRHAQPLRPGWLIGVRVRTPHRATERNGVPIELRERHWESVQMGAPQSSWPDPPDSRVERTE
jgi:hypothetical protein